MEQRLVAAGQRWPDALALGRTSPIGSGRYRATMRSKADQNRVVGIFIACELADIQFAAPPHFRRASVAEMRIVLPDRNFGATGFSIKVADQRVERFSHMSAAQIPRGHCSKQ